jgi:hypothetical protein
MNAFATSKFPAKPGAAKEQQAIAKVQIAEVPTAETQIAEAQIAEVQVVEAQIAAMGADKGAVMKIRAEVQVERALEMEGKFQGIVPREFLPM